MTEWLGTRDRPLSRRIESGDGFRIGTPGQFVFGRTPVGDATWSCVDRATGLTVRVRARESGRAVVVSSTLSNKGTAPVTGIRIVDPVSLVFRADVTQWRHLYANGGTSETYYPPLAYRTQERSHGQEKLRIESAPDGLSSNLHLPFLISELSPDGEGLFCGMEWSGAWYMSVHEDGSGRTRLNIGVQIVDLAMQPGEELRLPDVHLGFFRGGLEAGTNALRRHLYEQVCPLYRGKPVLPRVSYDHWFGIRNNYDVELLKRQARRAAELGVEVFVVDSAWFPGDFPDGVGNWSGVNRAKFPEGLEPLAGHVRGLGMDFGLWFEPERACAGTEIVREHPEWFIQVPFPVPRWSKHLNCHLNLACREAQDYLIEMVGGWIRRLDLRWSRWDYNIEPMPFWKAVDPTLKIQFAYFEGLNRVLDTLMREHPGWMVEGCASGGRRLDMGTMRRAHTYWFSDQTENPAICRYMQARANRFLPGHLLNSSVAVGAEAVDGEFNDTAVLSRMLGKLAFDGNIDRWPADMTGRAAQWVGVFKAIRHLLVQDFHSLLPQPQTLEEADAVQFVSYSGDEAVVFVFPGLNAVRLRLRLRGLQRDRGYEVCRLPGAGVCAVSGGELMTAGLDADLQPQEGALWHIRAR